VADRALDPGSIPRPGTPGFHEGRPGDVARGRPEHRVDHHRLVSEG